MYESFISTAQIKARRVPRAVATPRRSAMVRDALPQVTARPALPFLEILVRRAPRGLSLGGGTMRPRRREPISDLGCSLPEACVAEGAIIIIAISIDPPRYYRVGENQPQRHQRDTADPKSKRFAEYRRGVPWNRRHPPGARNGAGQGRAPAVRHRSKCPSIN
jgi:hypothetical protein